VPFTPESIALALFTALIAGLGTYLSAYAKLKGEVRAAREDLKQTILNLSETTRTVELEKAKIAADAALASDQRKAIYALATSTQTLIHSMCWLSWDAKTRRAVRSDMTRAYDNEAHRLLPEIFSQLALLKILDENLHSRAYPYASELARLDVRFGEAIVLSETNPSAGTEKLSALFEISNELQFDIDTLFGGKLRLVGPAKSSHTLAGTRDA